MVSSAPCPPFFGEREKYEGKKKRPGKKGSPKSAPGGLPLQNAFGDSENGRIPSSKDEH